jgi:hypothetical protein
MMHRAARALGTKESTRETSAEAMFLLSNEQQEWRDKLRA